MKKNITYLVLVVLLCSFISVAFKMAEKSKVFGQGSEIILNNTAEETGAINAVTAVVFDFRGFDTLGEAVVLFTAVSGVAVVLRSNKKSKEEELKWEKEKILS